MSVFAVDLGISVQEDSVATSSPKTAESSAVAGANGKNLGTEAKAEAPAVKSRFFLTLSRPVPGRTEDQAADSCTAPGKLDVSSSEAPGNKEPSDRMALPLAAAQGLNPDKTPGQTPAQHAGFSATCGPAPLPPESGGAALAKPKDAGFFDKFFKLDKGQEKAPTDSLQEAKRQEHQAPGDHTPGFSRLSHDVPAGRVSAGKGQSVLSSMQAQRGPGGGGGGDNADKLLYSHMVSSASLCFSGQKHLFAEQPQLWHLFYVTDKRR